MIKAGRDRNLNRSRLRKIVSRDSVLILNATAQRNQSHRPALRLRYCSWSFVCSTATSRGATALICAVPYFINKQTTCVTTAINGTRKTDNTLFSAHSATSPFNFINKGTRSGKTE